MSHSILVPVVAHRMFGRSLRGMQVRPIGPVRGQRQPLVPPPDPAFELREVADLSHGTRRPVEEIVRLFHEGDAPAFARGASVNRLWEPAQVQFVLVGVVDQMVDSLQADFVSADVRFRPDLSGHRYANAVNVFFFRDLEDASGLVHAGDIFMGDRWDPMTDAPGDREHLWRCDVITLSHEIGHLLGLSHRDDARNVMHGNGTSVASQEFEPAQAVFAQQRARVYRRPWYRAVPRDGNVRTTAMETPHVRGYAGDRLPTFD